MTEDELIETGTVEEFQPPPVPEPEPTQPVEVVSVDELVERLTAAAEEEPFAAESGGEPTSEPAEVAPVEIAGMEQLLQNLENMETTVVHSALETPFEEYTVTEGLLLLLLVLLVVFQCVKMIKGGFAWLLW